MTTDRELLDLLDETLAGDGAPAAALALHRALLAARVETAPAVSVPAEWPTAAEGRVRAGDPALRVGDLALEASTLAPLVARICEVAARHDTGRAAALGRLAGAMSGPRLESAVVAYVADRTGGITVSEDAALARFVLNQAMHPLLAPFARAVAALDAVRGWRHGSCPACGGRADFAALDPEDGARRLLCARCDAEWAYARVGCPACGETDAARYFATSGAYRLYTCERCGRYLKTVDLRETWHRRPLPLERILTVGLDVSAQAEGYVPA